MPPTATTITTATASLVDLEVETVRTDAIQSFLKQETIFVELGTADGLAGRGYSYTIGTGGHRSRGTLSSPGIGAFRSCLRISEPSLGMPTA